MKEFLVNENSENKINIEYKLHGIRKVIVPYIYDGLRKEGHFNDDIIVDNVHYPNFAEALVAVDKNNNKFFFSLDTLYGETKLKTDFYSSKYSCMIAKEIDKGHYKLFNPLDDINGDLYINNENILCVYKDYRKTDLVYCNRKKSNVEYSLTVENDELSDEEINEILNVNNKNNPTTLFDFITNLKYVKDLDRYTTIYIDAKSCKGTIGKINIKHGVLTDYDIKEQDKNYNLDITQDTVVATHNNSTIEVDKLPDNLQSIYKNSKQFLKSIEKKR